MSPLEWAAFRHGGEGLEVEEIEIRLLLADISQLDFQNRDHCLHVRDAVSLFRELRW